jgi:hypothetical protein
MNKKNKQKNIRIYYNQKENSQKVESMNIEDHQIQILI